ncbi:hypothetical protein ACFZBU_39325 [Embleya sp. NPDC008237]|uniref:hypothetical protein n=1 Tax=Embleya sp. NPDC008237 TaxID=3363978 RepID=UPI0036E16863
MLWTTIFAAEGTEALYAKADTVAAWIGEMLERTPGWPQGKGASRAGQRLANATVQQRLVAVRSFYEFLVEDGLRERNPVRRGQSGRRGRRLKRGLVRRIEQAPWIPTEADW